MWFLMIPRTFSVYFFQRNPPRVSWMSSIPSFFLNQLNNKIMYLIVLKKISSIQASRSNKWNVKKKKSISDINAIQTRTDNASSLMKKVCENPSKDTQDDECSLYSNLLAVKLRSLNNNTLGILMHNIDNMFLYAKFSNQPTHLLPQLPEYSYQMSPANSNLYQPSPTNSYISQPSPLNLFSPQYFTTDANKSSPLHTHQSQNSQANLQASLTSPENFYSLQPSPQRSYSSNEC